MASVKELNVTLGGKKHKLPIYFGQFALAEFCEQRGITIDQIDERLGGPQATLMDNIVLTWAGLKHGHRRTNQPFKYTLEQVGDMFDETLSLHKDVAVVFLESLPKAAGAAQEGDEGNGQEG